MEQRDLQRIREEILRLARQRGAGKSLCPSEVARGLEARAETGEVWRLWMPAVKEVAGVLASEGVIVITQRGKPVPIETVRGPIRLTLPGKGRDGEDEG